MFLLTYLLDSLSQPRTSSFQTHQGRASLTSSLLITKAQNTARHSAETHAQTSTPSGSITFLRKKQWPPTQPARRRRGQPQESLPGRSAATESAPNSSRAVSGWLAALTWCLADTELGMISWRGNGSESQGANQSGTPRLSPASCRQESALGLEERGGEKRS